MDEAFFILFLLFAISGLLMAGIGIFSELEALAVSAGIVLAFSLLFLSLALTTGDSDFETGISIERKPIVSEKPDSETLPLRNQIRIEDLEQRMDLNEYWQKRMMLGDMEPENCSVNDGVITCDIR